MLYQGEVAILAFAVWHSHNLCALSNIARVAWQRVFAPSERDAGTRSTGNTSVAKKKAELEDEYEQYHAAMRRAKDAERSGLYRGAVDAALEAFPYIDGMMQFARRYRDEEFATITAIDVVLKYAPLLLDYLTLRKLGDTLQEQRRIERNTSHVMADKLAEADALMRDAHRLWNFIDREPNCRQDRLRQVLGGSQDRWRSIAEGWEKMGLLLRSPEGGSYTLSLSTRMGQVVAGKCPSCGHVSEAPKAMFFEELDCAECGWSGYFVLLAPLQICSRQE